MYVKTAWQIEMLLCCVFMLPKEELKLGLELGFVNKMLLNTL